MPKKIDQEELNAIVASIAGVLNGVTINDLITRLDMPVERRSLQRRLSRLLNEGLIAKEGKGKATRYLPVHKEQALANVEEFGREDEAPLQLPVSEAGKEIFRLVQRPLALRERVGYQRRFLDEYEANHSAYLPGKVRRHLEQIGRVHGGMQPAGTYARKIFDRLLIDLSFNSSRLEGNTYSLLETKRLIKLGRAGRGHNAEETQMIMNHKDAIEFLIESAEQVAIKRQTILNLHALLSDNLLGDPAASGRLRRSPVTIGGSSYLPNAVPQVIDECFGQIIQVTSRIENPFEQCFFLLVQLPYLQPFEDVNKRLSRLSANIPLIRHNLRPLSFIDVPQKDYTTGLLGVYELNRVELLCDVFVWAYERSAEQYSVIRDSLGTPDEFRLQYRTEIKTVVGKVIQDLVPAEKVVEFIARWAKRSIPNMDQPKFIVVVEAELVGLHEGNYARYPVTPGQYEAWASLDS